MDETLQRLLAEYTAAEERFRAAMRQLDDVPTDRFKAVVHPKTLDDIAFTSREVERLGREIRERVFELSDHPLGRARREVQ